MVEYAVYKGDELLCFGTVEEIANKLNVQKKTIWFWSSPANQKRLASRKGGNSNGKLAVKIED